MLTNKQGLEIKSFSYFFTQNVAKCYGSLNHVTKIVYV